MARIGSEGGTEIIIPGISHAATESQEGGMVNPASRQGYAGSLGQKRIERLGERLGLIEHDEVAAARYHLRLEGRDVRILRPDRRLGGFGRHRACVVRLDVRKSGGDGK